MAADRPRLRRSSAEVRVLLHTAAREVFQAKGYHAASTREIAECAGVTEPMLFRHFGSKANLFEQAVFAPFIGFIDDFVQRWSRTDYADLEPPALARAFIYGIYELLVDNKYLLAALLAERGGQSIWPEHMEGDDLLGAHLDTLTRKVEAFLASQGQATIGLTAGVRMSISTLLGVALLEEDLFGGAGDGQSRSLLVEDMADFLLRAIGYTPDAAA